MATQSRYPESLPNTAIDCAFTITNCVSLRLQDLADRSVCLSDPKGSATISPEVASPRDFQRLQEVVLEHLYSSRSYVSLTPLLRLHDLIRTAIKVGPTYIKRKHPPGQTVGRQNHSASRYKNLHSLGCSAPQGTLYCPNLPLSFFLYG